MFAFQSTASSGELTANHFSGIPTGAIFTGGYPESPSAIVATSNRMVNNNLGGIVLIGSSIFIPELGDQLDAVVRGNDRSNNAGTQGFGLRMFILRRDRVAQAIRNPRAISGARSRQPDGRQPSWIDARCRLSLPKLGWRL